MNRKGSRTSWYLTPFKLIWDLLEVVIKLTGRLVALIIGLALMVVGLALTVLIISAPIGIPLMIFGFLLMIRGIF